VYRDPRPSASAETRIGVSHVRPGKSSEIVGSSDAGSGSPAKRRNPNPPCDLGVRVRLKPRLDPHEE